MGDAFAGVEDCSGCPPRSKETENGLVAQIQLGHLEVFEHAFDEVLSLRLGVVGGLGQQDLVLLGGDSQLLVEELVLEYFLEHVDVFDDSVSNWLENVEHRDL